MSTRKKNGERRISLTKRPLDLFYFSFFAMHFVSSAILDMQYFYPVTLVPTIQRKALDWYISEYRDPMIGGIFDAFGDSTHLAWFKSFMWLEALFQMPVFLIGMYTLYHNKRVFYPLFAFYGASTATTTLACVVWILVTPETTPALLKAGAASVNAAQRFQLLASYVPFCLIPLGMAIDMSLRVLKLVKAGIRIEEDGKQK